jgi:Histidinol dehydrogenase
VTEGYQIGGAQAIAALAYGTARIARVDKVVGPGNIYVALAKARVFGEVGIDMVAGPSEVVVVADATADPDCVASDMLAQAEHDPMARALLVTDAGELIPKVAAALERQLAALPRRTIAAEALRANGSPIDWPPSIWSYWSPCRPQCCRACATPAPSSSAATPPRSSATTWLARTTCCRPPAPRGSPRRSGRRTS